jgi:hypothetical protein
MIFMPVTCLPVHYAMIGYKIKMSTTCDKILKKVNKTFPVSANVTNNFTKQETSRQRQLDVILLFLLPASRRDNLLQRLVRR